MKKQKSKNLSEKIKYGYNYEETWGQDVMWLKDVKKHIQNAQKKLKEEIRDDKFMSVDELLLTADDIDEIIDKIFSEEFGEKLK